MAFLDSRDTFKSPLVNEPFQKLPAFVCISLFWGHFNLFTGLHQTYADNGRNQHRNIQKLFCAMNSIIEETLHMNKEYIYHVHIQLYIYKSISLLFIDIVEKQKCVNDILHGSIPISCLNHIIKTSLQHLSEPSQSHPLRNML